MLNLLFASLLSSAVLPPAQTSKDEFVFNNKGEPETIDPQRMSGVIEAQIAYQLFQGLMTRKQDWLTMVVGDAEGFPKVSPDKKVYTFKLRKKFEMVGWKSTHSKRL